MPLISVIIPAFNAEKTIEATIQSVTNQTFTDFELIIVNDGSTDRTLEIVNSIEDPRIRVLSYPNSGRVSISRNRGFTQAVGEFIAFLDADDLWTPEKLDLQLKALQSNPQAAVAYSWVDCIDENGKFLRSTRRISINGDVHGELLLGNFLENGSNPLIRKQALIEVGNFDETLLNAEDHDLYLRLAANYQFVCVPVPVVLYRISPNSKSCNVVRMEAQSRRVIEKGFERAPAPLKHLKKQSLTNLYVYLTRKALEGPPDPMKGWRAAKYFWQYLLNDSERFQRMQFNKTLFVKIVKTIIKSPFEVASFRKGEEINIT